MSGDYPTDDELERIASWDVADPRGWFGFVRSVWWAPDWGWHEATIDAAVTRYSISTGGWSGNEDIVGAMEGNLLWHLTWMESRRGGHYVFELPPALVGKDEKRFPTTVVGMEQKAEGHHEPDL